MAEEVAIRSRDVYYRGVKLEDLKKQDVRECAKYLPARSRRSVLRHFDIVEKFVKRCEENIKNNKKIRTHLRDMVIVPQLIGIIISVHNGRHFNDVHIVPEMIGHRLGEFSLTRSKVSHGSPGIGATKSSSGDKK